MANSRIITSAIWEDDWFGQLDFFEQALWIGLFSKVADDQGRLLDNSILLRAAIFPYKDIDVARIDAALKRFANAERIYRYEAKGKKLLQILKWWAHQPQQWASASQWQAPAGWQDHVRTRENGEYKAIDWHGKAKNAEVNADWGPDCPIHLNVQVNDEHDAQVGGHIPVPVPIPVPIHIPDPDPVPSTPEGHSAPVPAAVSGEADTRANFVQLLVERGVTFNNGQQDKTWYDLLELTSDLGMIGAALDECIAKKHRLDARYTHGIVANCVREGRMPGEWRAKARASPKERGTRALTIRDPITGETRQVEAIT